MGKWADHYDTAHSSHKIVNPVKHQNEISRTMQDTNEHRGTFRSSGVILKTFDFSEDLDVEDNVSRCHGDPELVQGAQNKLEGIESVCYSKKGS